MTRASGTLNPKSLQTGDIISIEDSHWHYSRGNLSWEAGVAVIDLDTRKSVSWGTFGNTHYVDKGMVEPWPDYQQVFDAL